MTTYKGPATVIAGEAMFEVHAALIITTEHVAVPGGGTRRGLSEWHGTLRATDDDAAWAIYDADQPVLQIDGRQGSFISTRTQVGSDEIQIQGSGAAPFGG